MNYENIRTATGVLTTFKKIEEDGVENSKNKAKNAQTNLDANLENLNKIFGNLPSKSNDLMENSDQLDLSSDKATKATESG
jgi:hypothetical protein